MLTRLYLITPRLADLDSFLPDLLATIAAVHIDAVLLTLPDADDLTLIRRIQAVAPLVQEAGAALLVEDRLDLVARGGADGAHVAGIARLQDVRSVLPAQRILGVGGLHSRHDAMVAGESGADYVMFGEPDRDGQIPVAEAVIERTVWWAEIFEPACVAYATQLGAVADLAAAGADFVALGDAVWNDSRGPLAAIREAASALTRDKVP